MNIKINNISFKVLDTHIDFWTRYNQRLWERLTLDALSEHLNKDSIYIDMGAWIGPTVLYASQLCKHCYAIEPDSVAFDILKKNIQLNKFNNITLYDGAIAEVSEPIRLYSNKEIGDSTSTIMQQRSGSISTTVEALHFEDYLNRFNIVECHVIKMDIEGAEVIVIPDMMDYLMDYQPTLILAVHVRYMKSATIPVLRDIISIYTNVYIIIKNQIIQMGKDKRHWLENISSDYIIVATK